MPKIGSYDGDGRSTAGVPDRLPHAAAEHCLVVGIGASAGGQAALEQLFAFMPEDCGIVFIVVMHLPPEGPSFLAEMLTRYTAMEVVTAEEGMALRPNAVFVLPAGKELLVKNRSLVLRPASPHGGLHHVDLLFGSLAQEVGDRCVAVVLSGAGQDGAEGVKAVKDHGGMVMVQDPLTAIFPEMLNNAIGTGCVDSVLSAEEIAVTIAGIARGTCHISSPACTTASVEDEMRAILAVVKERTGHDFSSYKTNTILRRIERRMAVNEVAGIKKYLSLVEVNPEEALALSRDILIGVTSFFRDRDAFDTIRRIVIPELFENRSSHDPVRIWHACCSTGEEVYSMAILIKEFLEERNLQANVQIFASDIDEAAIAQARAGIYPLETEADLDGQVLEKWFTKVDGRWQVVKPVREMVVFAQHSLIKNPPFSRLDLLVCRNFLIYLNADMQGRLMNLFHQVLKPRGVLFLGSSETVGSERELFEPVDKKWKIYRRRETNRRATALFPFATPHVVPGAAGRVGKGETTQPVPAAVADKLLIERYAPPSVLVNERLEIVHITSGTEGLLNLPLGEPSRDLLKMAREELRPALRAAVYKALREERQVTFQGIRLSVGKEERIINVVAEPFSGAAGGNLAFVVFEPAVTPAYLIPQEKRGGSEKDENSKDQLIRQLEEQLRLTHEQLHAATEQLQTINEAFLSANEELISMNEEYQSSNEELQSTNEELETSKEELQALNEELVTVNSELHQKVEELNRLNSDMENLMQSSEIASIFLDRGLIIRRYTPAMAQIYDLIPADIGRPFRHLLGTLDWSGLATDAEAVLQSLAPVEREVMALATQRPYLMRILPYRTAVGAVDGIVVNLVDISEMKKMEVRTLHLASFPQLNPNPVLEVDDTGTIIFSNPATVNVLESVGMSVADVPLFLPVDFSALVTALEPGRENVLYREVEIGSRVYGETLLAAADSHVIRIYAYDITDTRRAEELARHQNRLLQTVNRILYKTLTVQTAEELGEVALSVVEELTASRFGFIGEIGPDGLLHAIALSDPGWEACTMCRPPGERRPPGDFKLHGLYGEVLLTGKPFLCNAPSAHPASIGVPKGHPPLHSFLGVPLLHGDRVTGMIAVGNKEGGYSSVDRESLESLAPAIVEAFQRKRAEDSLRRSEAEANARAAELAAVMDALPVGVSIVDERGGKIRSNKAFSDVWGGETPQAREVKDYVGYRAWWADSGRLVAPEEWASAIAVTRGEAVIGQLMQIEKVDGSRAFVHNSAAPIKDASGRVTGSAVAIQDISLLRETEGILEKTARRFQLVADVTSRLLQSPDPQQIVESLCREVMAHVECDAFFNFLFDERAGKLHLNACAGISEEEARGIEWLELGAAVCGCAARDACQIVAEHIPTTEDSRTDFVKSIGIKAYACNPLFGPEGKVIGTLSFGTRSRDTLSEEDISLMKVVADHVAVAMIRIRHEEGLVQSREGALAASKSKSQFLANMSHELRTPMNGLLGMVQLALAGSLEPKQRDFLENALKSGRHLLTILNDILDLSRVEAGKLVLQARPFSLRECVAAAVELFSQEARVKGVQLSAVVTESVPESVVGDNVRLRQVLVNLIGNGVKYTDRGTVDVEVVSRVAGAGACAVTFSVNDTGIGIPPDKHDVIFGSFSQVDDSDTRSYGGIGLGLAISRNIVELMGGTLSVQSEEGKGSRFSFTVSLPVTGTGDGRTEDEHVAPAIGVPRFQQPDEPSRILVAEDDAMSADLMVNLLQLSGYLIDLATTGEEAVAMWETGRYDLVVMDVQMPQLDGLAATATIRHREKERGVRRIPIIGLSAHAYNENQAECIAAGMDVYLTKPVDLELALEAIADLLCGAV